MASCSASLRSDIWLFPVTGLVAHAAEAATTSAKRRQRRWRMPRSVQPLYHRIQGLFQRFREEIDQFLGRARAHQPDAEHLAGQRPKPRADLDVVVLQQLL